MKKLSLDDKGLSMSQAQSVSNICNQRVIQLSADIALFNNHSSKINISGNELILVDAHPIPDDIKDILTKIGKLSGVQAFLMENIKGKEVLMKRLKLKKFDPNTTTTHYVTEGAPKQPTLLIFNNEKTLVDEEWGWEQLTLNEVNEYYEQEALAAHYGKFIHKDGKLTLLRAGLEKTPNVEWFELEKDKKSPIENVKHHDSKKLLELHEGIAALHRDAEQRVNYFKAKVKNLVSAENSKIEKENADKISTINAHNSKLRQEYLSKYNNWQDKQEKLVKEFEAKRYDDISALASKRILIPGRFKEIIDDILSKLNNEEAETK